MDWDSWDTLLNVWAIAAKGPEHFKLPAEVPDEWRQAASVLLGLPEVGLLARWRGFEASRLKALGGDPWEGLRLLPKNRPGHRERCPARSDGACTCMAALALEQQEFYQRVFGARKAVIEEFDLPPVRNDLGELEDPLPKSLTTPPGAPNLPAATARRLIAWARDREVETEVLDGPFVGQDLTTWKPIELAYADDALAKEPVSLRLFFRQGHRMVLWVPPGRENPWAAAQCESSQPQCEIRCPLVGRGVCDKRENGVGWHFKELVRASDERRILEIPAHEQPAMVSEFVDAVKFSRRPPALAETA